MILIKMVGGLPSIQTQRIKRYYTFTLALKSSFDPLGDKQSNISLVAVSTLWDNQVYTIDQMPLLAARISTLREDKTGLNKQKDQHLMEFLASNKHMTPFEHIAITFRVEAPIFVFREWQRHRTESYNEASMRYTTDLAGLVYIPNEWRLQDTKNKQGSKDILTENDLLPNPDDSSDETDKIQNQELGYLVWEYAKYIGSFRKKAIANYAIKKAYTQIYQSYRVLHALGIAKELCRLPIAVGNYSQMYATALVRNWKQFYDLRATPDAQWEIRQYAYCIGEMIQELIPDTWQALTKHKDVGLTENQIEIILEKCEGDDSPDVKDAIERLKKAKQIGKRI